MKPAYYNELDGYCVQWLRNLISAGLIPAGDVDDRSIVDVRPDDLRGYGQCHFFAGIGGFALACRLAGVPDGEEIWTGGFPCQPFSVAGRQLEKEDDRHLWPVLSRLIEQARPAVFVGENVAGIIDLALDGVLFDMESAGYASRAIVVPACAVNAPHRRDRVWIAARRVADADSELHDGSGNPGTGRWAEPSDSSSDVEHAQSIGRGEGRSQPELRSGGAAAAGAGLPHGDVVNSDKPRLEGRASLPERGDQRASGASGVSGFWDGAEYRTGADGKARRVEPGLRLLAHGIPSRVAKVRAGGNAIVPQVAAEIIKAVMGSRP